MSVPSASIVTCVEYGSLETMSIRMIESLRRWGGDFANLPVYAVKPRFGIPLRKETLKAFDRLNVTFMDIRPDTSYTWFRFLNKPLSVMAVADRVDSEEIFWIDADVIVASEPNLYRLGPEDDVLVCASDKNIGTTGPGDEFEAFWVEAAKVFGWQIDDLPWITDQRTGKPIRFYWNAGVFAYRRSTRFGHLWHDATIKFLESKVAMKRDDVIFHEQMALGFAILQHKLRWRALPDTHNLPVGKLLGHLHDPEKFRNSPIIHYHGCMWPDFWDKFLDLFKIDRPDIYEWLKPKGPVTYAPPLLIKAAKKVIDMKRSKATDAFVATCKRY